MTNDIMIEYTDVAYTSKRGRKAIFDAINDDILRDFLEHDVRLFEIGLRMENMRPIRYKNI